MYGNKITFIERADFAGFTSLYFLWLDENDLIAVPDVSVLCSYGVFEQLWLEDNPIHDVFPSYFNGCNALTSVRISQSQDLNYFPDFGDAAPIISELRFVGSFISEVPADLAATYTSLYE